MSPSDQANFLPEVMAGVLGATQILHPAVVDFGVSHELDEFFQVPVGIPEIRCGNCGVSSEAVTASGTPPDAVGRMGSGTRSPSVPPRTA
jgi:hypothetical protein